MPGRRPLRSARCRARGVLRAGARRRRFCPVPRAASAPSPAGSTRACWLASLRPRSVPRDAARRPARAPRPRDPGGGLACASTPASWSASTSRCSPDSWRPAFPGGMGAPGSVALGSYACTACSSAPNRVARSPASCKSAESVSSPAMPQTTERMPSASNGATVSDGTTTTGHGASRMSAHVTLPRSAGLTVDHPPAPMTMSSASSRSATSISVLAVWPAFTWMCVPSGKECSSAIALSPRRVRRARAMRHGAARCSKLPAPATCNKSARESRSRASRAAMDAACLLAPPCRLPLVSSTAQMMQRVIALSFRLTLSMRREGRQRHGGLYTSQAGSRSHRAHAASVRLEPRSR